MNVLTFDVEDWFHVLDNDATRSVDSWSQYPTRIHSMVDCILEILDTHNVCATFFCLGWIAERYPEVIYKIHASGHEIGSHSYAHQLAYDQSRTQFQHDLKRSVSLLEDIVGDKIRSYRAPGFSLTYSNRWVFDVLIENGIEVDCSIFPAERAHGGYKEFSNHGPVLVKTASGTIREMPINVYSILGRPVIFSGGGYFRLFPYFFIRHFAKQSSYLMTYLHPRDFDWRQPLVPGLGLKRRFKSYYGLRNTTKKLNRMLNEFDFTGLQQAVDSLDWQKVPIVEINI